jgi:hypothetical protein
MDGGFNCEVLSDIKSDLKKKDPMIEKISLLEEKKCIYTAIFTCFSELLSSWSITKKENEKHLEIEYTLFEYDLIDKDLDYDRTHWEHMTRALRAVICKEVRRNVVQATIDKAVVDIQMQWKKNTNVDLYSIEMSRCCARDGTTPAFKCSVSSVEAVEAFGSL